MDCRRHFYSETRGCDGGAAYSDATGRRNADATQATNSHANGSGSRHYTRLGKNSIGSNRDRRTDTGDGKANVGATQAHEHI